MSLAAPPGPTTAERIRSACLRAPQALLALEGATPETTPVHHLLADGSVALAVPDGGPVARRVTDSGGLQAVLELTDYAPLPLREPVRLLVWIRGSLHAVPDDAVRATVDLIATANPDPGLLDVGSGHTLLRLDVESVVVADASGAESVDVAALLDARPDPFCAMETHWLRHLDVAHQDVVSRQAAKLPGPLRRGRVRPLGLDRYGIRLRIEGADGDRDIRLPFGRPVDDLQGLSQALRILMGCPFVNGLRARPA